MSGTLSIGLSREWKARLWNEDDRPSIEAHIPDDHILFVVNRGTKPRHWVIRLIHDGVDLWSMRVDGHPLYDALKFALVKHAPTVRVTTNGEGFVTDIEEVYTDA